MVSILIFNTRLMKKYFSIFVVFVLTNILFAQVGINTSDPKSTLDINGNLKIRSVSNLPALNSNHTVLIRDKTSTTGDFEVKEVNSDFLVVNNGNASVYYASGTGAGSLVSLTIPGVTGWARISLLGAVVKLGSSSLFTNGSYTAPQPGIYMVNYEFQLESGVDIEVLGGKKIGIVKNSTILWDEKYFDAVRVAVVVPPLINLTLAAVPVTSTSMTSLMQLNTGDTISFAINTGGVNISLLENAKIKVYIYKISN